MGTNEAASGKLPHHSALPASNGLSQNGYGVGTSKKFSTSEKKVDFSHTQKSAFHIKCGPSSKKPTPLKTVVGTSKKWSAL